MMNETRSVRANVILTLEKIHEGCSLSVLLDELFTDIKDNERAFTHELLLGTLRQWYALNRIGESLIKTPPNDVGIICALNMGLYELIYMHTPDYAAINETITALKSLGKSYGAGLINAILRKVADKKDKFSKKIQKNHSLPNHLAKEIKQDWGEYYDALGQTLRQSAPIFLRVNPKFTDIEDYAKHLNGANIAHEILPLGVNDACVIKLDGSVKIRDLPYFAEGFVSVQDRHAQLCGQILKGAELPNNLNVLDACTAPGGKLSQMLEMAETKALHIKHMTALDHDEDRLKRVHENLARLHLKGASIICADATTYQARQPFDVIVLDAPCTATGVIRRHPDIALLRTQEDLSQTADLQAKILQNLWQNLAIGGYLLYVTCSLLKRENETQLLHFTAKNADAKAVDFTLTLPNQIKQIIGYQCLPLNRDDGDGFYYALLQKV